MDQKIGILGGSFNPIHFGHIQLAIEMLEKHRLDRILFCPAAESPFKANSTELVASDHRLAMVKLAIADIPQFAVIENELRRPTPSYTIDTIEELQVECPGAQFFLIIGDDAATSFHRWYRAHEIVSHVQLLVGARQGQLVNVDPKIAEALKKGMTETKIFEVSSTEIRERLKERKYCGHLVPSKVLDYIYQNGLYYNNLSC